MKLLKLEIKKLYGFMNKVIDFNNHLNLLVGINGSGKTSVLNVIYWIMQPSYSELCTTEFEQLRLTFLYNEQKHIITCEQTDEELTIHVTIDGEKLHPLVTRLPFPTSRFANDRNLKDRFFKTYSKLRPSQDEIQSWTYFLQLPNPIIISIDRKLESDPIKSDELTNPNLNFSSSSLASLDIVKKYSNEAYTSYNKKVIDLNKVLRNRILLSSFESSIINLNELVTSTNKLAIKDVNKLETSFTKFLAEDEDTDIETSNSLKHAIRDYADSMRNIIQSYKSIKSNNSNIKDKANKDVGNEKRNAETTTSYILNSNQFARIQKLLIDFSKYEDDSSKAYKNVQIYLESVNHFLKDSSKELLFKKDDGQLYYKLKDKHNNDLLNEQSIDGLSSGERQILILFTYLAFGDVKGKVVIIDEPEISLHPKWQDDFLQQLNKVTPPNAQLIVATHSPSIVGELEDNCKVLLPYND